MVPVTVAGTITGALTYTTMGLIALLNTITLEVNDGSTNRYQTNSSGAALMRRAARILNGYDTATLSALGANLNAAETASSGSSAGTYNICIPLLFKHPQISDPIGSATMLPLPRYNTNPKLTVIFDQLAAAISTNHGATLTIGSPYVIQNFRQVDNIIFPTLDTQFQEKVVQITGTGANQNVYLDVPGNYTAIDIYSANSSGVGADISGGLWFLEILGQTLRSFNLSDVKRQEQFSMGNDSYYSKGAGAYTDLFPGFYHLDFLHDGFGMEVGELGSLLNSNVLAGSGSLVQMQMNIGSTGSVSFAYERIMGDLSPYTLQFNTAAG